MCIYQLGGDTQGNDYWWLFSPCLCGAWLHDVKQKALLESFNYFFAKHSILHVSQGSDVTNSIHEKDRFKYRNHPFSTFAKFSEKLIFLTP